MILYEEVEREEIKDKKDMYRVVDYLGQHSGYLKRIETDNWIKVEDKLPEYMDVVIICCKIGIVTVAQYTGDGNLFSTGSWTSVDLHTATHWQPLPSPPDKK